MSSNKFKPGDKVKIVSLPSQYKHIKILNDYQIVEKHYENDYYWLRGRFEDTIGTFRSIILNERYLELVSAASQFIKII